MEPLTIADTPFNSRLIMGTSLYPNPEVMREALAESETELVTVSIRRMDMSKGSESGTILDYLKADGYQLLPNTAGCYTAKDAIFTAQLAREALGTNWVKLEVIGDEETLFPDVTELLKGAEELIKQGFEVLPYCNDDPITCQKLSEMGCAAVMPLGAPIGSGMGLRNPYNLQIIRDQVEAPLIIDAGVGTASDAAYAMELGYDGILLNSAVARAEHPVRMAKAMKLGIQAGLGAREAGRIPSRLYARPSSPTNGVVSSGHGS
jgi:thiazole synthase